MEYHTRVLRDINLSILAGLFLLGVTCVTGCHRTPENTAAVKEDGSQLTFANPEQVAKALYTAARSHDDRALERILGPHSVALLSSGDRQQDKAALASLVTKYDRMNRWATLTDGRRILYIGADNYPYPIPLVQGASSRWYFDTAAGEDEILARRIGKNELLALDAVYAIGNAEELYFKSKQDGDGAHKFTQKILSSSGKQDGLYWQVAKDQAASPLGRLNDFAKDVLTSTQAGAPPVFDGYSFRVLAGQGDHAKGNARSYLRGGEMTDGFGILAAPVTYGDSGIMTFMMNRDGVAYQKDLGPKTTEAAAVINSYDPGSGWTPAE